MPATSPEAKARKAKRHEQRRRERGLTREARRKSDPAKRLEANRKRWSRRIGTPEKHKAYLGKQRTKVAAKFNARPFVGCDGEGAKDSDGRSRYVLFRMGTRELQRGGERLTTPELLQFIVDHPDAAAILVGFFFDYDVSNILRDVPAARDPVRPDMPSRLERILQVDLKAAAGDPNPYKFGGWTALRFEGYDAFGVQYIPRNFLKVCRLVNHYDRERDLWTQRSAPGSTRTIFDVQGFFQCSFLNALTLWGVGADHWDGIKQMKDARADFAGLSREVRDYCAIECGLLAQMMQAFREQCVATGMTPRTWNGAGKIASALLKANDAMKAARLYDITPGPVIDLAHAAYYGGRFEITWAGRLPATWEHDINSAYPDAMLRLPCLEHGTWHKVSGKRLAKLARNEGELFVARVGFSHPRRQFLCGLPFRSKQGRLSWPRNGNGVYWSCEIRSAERLGATIDYKGGWRFAPACDCRPYEFVRELYEKRRQIGKSVRGVPIKLGLNSIYGKKAQRIGKPTYANPIEAGLITALTRARINDAIVAAGDPRRVVMIATDGVYTVEGPIGGLPQGEGLGQWEVKQFAGLFIVRPGLYWPIGLSSDKTNKKRKLKSRGLSPKFFEPLIPTFEAAWDNWMATKNLPDPAACPVVAVPIETFVGVRFAMRLKDPLLACQWIKRDGIERPGLGMFPPINCKFSWADKRRGVQRLGAALVLGALPGDADANSHHYDASGALQSATLFELDRMIFEAQPDYMDLSPPRD